MNVWDIKFSRKLWFTKVLSSNTAANEIISKKLFFKHHRSYLMGTGSSNICSPHTLHSSLSLNPPNFMPVGLAVEDPVPGNKSGVSD